MPNIVRIMEIRALLPMMEHYEHHGHIDAPHLAPAHVSGQQNFDPHLSFRSRDLDTCESRRSSFYYFGVGVPMKNDCFWACYGGQILRTGGACQAGVLKHFGNYAFMGIWGEPVALGNYGI